MIDDLHHRLHHLSTATVSMQLLKRGLRHVFIAGVRPLRGDQPRIAGPVSTLRFLPYREDLDDPARRGHPESAQRRAIEQTPEGHVLVVETRGELGGGVLGDILATRLLSRGVAGLVTDGAVRDAEGIRATGFPVVCAGTAAPASYNVFSDGDRDLPIAVGGVAVLPDDSILADGDGAVVIPAGLVAEIVEAGEEQEKLEAWIQGEAVAGKPLPGLYPPDKETLARYRAWQEGDAPID
jgi:regulator of RNase E activity RraA